jgi:N-acetylglutamate synthase-like GNAT family acetyltransferase
MACFSFGVAIRRAGIEDLDALHELSAAAIRELCAGDYTAEQIETALRFGMGVDAQLVRDRTLYVVKDRGRVVAAGGWSYRAALMGNTHPDYHGKPRDVLDPSADAARLRCFFVHPEFARRGLGRGLVGVCEREAAEAGFSRMEVMATVTGRRLYLACGFEDVETMTNVFPNGVAAVGWRMSKRLEVGSMN